MKTTTKVSLNDNNSIGFGVLVFCCGVHQQVNYDLLRSGEWWECASCYKPLVLVTDQGWFVVGNKIVS